MECFLIMLMVSNRLLCLARSARDKPGSVLFWLPVIYPSLSVPNPARFAPSKDQFPSERKKSGSSLDSAFAATSIPGSGIFYVFRSRRAHRIAWR
jgi:hypothetical protein